MNEDKTFHYSVDLNLEEGNFSLNFDELKKKFAQLEEIQKIEKGENALMIETEYGGYGVSEEFIVGEYDLEKNNIDSLVSFEEDVFEILAETLETECKFTGNMEIKVENKKYSKEILENFFAEKEWVKEKFQATFAFETDNGNLLAELRRDKDTAENIIVSVIGTGGLNLGEEESEENQHALKSLINGYEQLEDKLDETEK